ncbi:hypothetical protein NT6N_18780 [Oceaniferula spumae]|uniref:FecR protein domain-containing protein n=1 Tax=Oceaniferula spumae TaxID=2979115 RepID=A0AAT9FLK7_9BACT
MNEEKRVLELMAIFQDGDATESQIAELKDLLKEDEALLALARKQASLHAQLSIVLENEFAAERRRMKFISAVKESDTDQFVQGVKARLTRRRWFSRMAAVAAALLIGFGAAIYFSNQVQPDAIMATVDRVEGVQWHGDLLQQGEQLAVGQSVKIDKGLLEMDLDGRGRLIVEGPAHIDFPESGKAVLHQGRIVMRATEKGHGYRVETPQGSIVDLGTEFGVSVGQDGIVETHVIEGSVEAIPTRGKSVTLLQNKAMRLASDGGHAIDADAGKFYTQMPPEHQETVKSIHWSFNETSGNVARATGELADAGDVQPDMVFYADGEGKAPERVKGMLGGALSFDGVGAYAESGYRGIEGGKPRSVCFWLKVPEDFVLTQGFGIVSWGRLKHWGEVWQVSVNPLADHGPIGRLRLGSHGGQVVGSTDLRDGKWHHIGVVMYGGSQPNVGTHVILYVDGVQERVSRRALQEVRTEIEQAEHGVWLGRNTSFKKHQERNAQGKFFRGGLDELYIFDAALSQAELLQIMESGSPDR